MAKNVISRFKFNNIKSLPRIQFCEFASKSKAIPEVPDEVTHTGQCFAPNDYRLARFTNKHKLVNRNFAIDLIAKVPPKVTEERAVACDGGVGALGHPKVYINLDKPGPHACIYCGLRFEKKGHH